MTEVQLSKSGNTATLTLNAPERHNALTRGMIGTLMDHLDAIGRDTDIRALVLTATGKSFCAGADLGNVADQDWTENPLTDLCDRLETARPATICAMQGGVYGGGVELALACDFRIGVEGMKMFVPAAELGIHYPSQGLARAERLLGLQVARRIFLLAEKFDDQALAQTAFLDQLVAPEELAQKTEQFAQRVTDLAPLAVQGMKQSFAEITTSPPDYEAARPRIAGCFKSEDHKSALAARKTRSVPDFQGR